MQESWTIAELAELAAEKLAAADSAEPPSGAARANGRVRDVPNERLVRWYVTVGLVDPPLSRRGRVARYGRRHLLQLVAIKRRQAEGRSLAEIQAELTGATDETLATVARVPDSHSAPDTPPAAPARFWARQPTQAAPGTDQTRVGTGRPNERVRNTDRRGQWAAAAAPAAGAGQSELDTGRPAEGGYDPDLRDRPGRWVAAPLLARPSAGAVGGTVHGVRLAAGVTLLVEGGERELGAEDAGGIIGAAGALLEELARRRLRVADGQVAGASGEVGDLAEEGGQ